MTTTTCGACGKAEVIVGQDCPTCGLYAAPAKAPIKAAPTARLAPAPAAPVAKVSRKDAEKAALAKAISSKLPRRAPRAARTIHSVAGPGDDAAVETVVLATPRGTGEPHANTVSGSGDAVTAPVYVDVPVANPSDIIALAEEASLLGLSEEPMAPPETREAWLIRAVDAMRPWFPDGVPEVRVSVGFPVGRGSSRLIGQCWYTTADKAPALFVSPELTGREEVLTTLAHEMCHAAVGGGHGHKGPFIKVARHIGLTAPWKSSPAGPELTERVNALAAELGEFPHAKVSKLDALRRPTTQSTRMLKVECGECGYTVRTTRKWLDVGVPSCPDGHEMQEVA